jgi:hypothetical protein
MIKQLGETWRGFWRKANNLALAMDADPLEDVHRRIRRLEAAFLQPEVQREPAGALNQPSEPAGAARTLR